MPSFPLLAACFASTGLAACAIRVAWRLQSVVNALSERVDELSARLGAAEYDVARAGLSAEVAESVLVEKGVADEEELEEARRRTQTGGPEYVRERDGELH
jgi:hypothetical protein